jgi:Flp pilus assembly protein protease CpaA
MEPYLTWGLELAAAGVLAFISWQDWQARSVSWPAFPLLAGCLLASRLLHEPAAAVASQGAVNLLLVGLLLATLALYVRLRFGAAGPRLAQCLGSGDVVFWLVLAAYLSPPTLLLFLLLSSLVGLLLVAVRLVRPLPGQATLTVPLAGIQAGCLLVGLAGHWVLPGWAPDFPFIY